MNHNLMVHKWGEFGKINKFKKILNVKIKAERITEDTIASDMKSSLSRYKNINDKLFYFLYKLPKEILIFYMKSKRNLTSKYWDDLFGFVYDDTKQLSQDHLIYLILTMYYEGNIDIDIILYGSKGINRIYDNLNMIPLIYE